MRSTGCTLNFESLEDCGRHLEVGQVSSYVLDSVMGCTLSGYTCGSLIRKKQRFGISLSFSYFSLEDHMYSLTSISSLFHRKTVNLSIYSLCFTLCPVAAVACYNGGFGTATSGLRLSKGAPRWKKLSGRPAHFSVLNSFLL